MNFVSDHLYGIHGTVLAAICSANTALTSPSYSADDWTARAAKLMNGVFERDVETRLVSTGTIANAMALASLVRPFNAVLAYCDAHIIVDECGAVEFYSGGARTLGIKEPRGKITAAGLEARLKGFVRAEHDPVPSAVSITQSSELGTVYTVEEVAAIAEVARAHGMKVHMDGARFANAVASLGCAPAEVTWKAGVDVLSFGTTKNGTMGVDAIVFFDRDLAAGFAHRQLQAGQLMSKSRFLGAQMEAYLTNDLWLDNARKANANATRLAEGIKDATDLRLPLGAEANQLFPIVSRRLYDHLIAAGAQFAVWPGVGSLIDQPSEDEVQIRLVTSFNTRQEDIDAFIAAVHAAGVQ